MVLPYDGILTIFEALASVDTFRTGLLDGSLPVTRLFTANVLPLVSALQNNDKFATARIVRYSSPLLSAERLSNATALSAINCAMPRSQLRAY